MRWESQALAAVLAAMLIGCGPRDNADRDTGTAGTPGESPSAVTSTPGTTTDTTSVGGTAGAGTGVDTAADSAKASQSQSGVTNTKTGEATTGAGVTKTRPDQAEPVTSKGDTISRADDSATKPPR